MDLGVTESVQQKTEAVQANVICTDNLLLRTCEHGVRHPVGHLDKGFVTEHDIEHRHEVRTDTCGLVKYSACCDAACCVAWRSSD